MELLHSKEGNDSMKNTFKKTFSTGEFAKLFGMNKDTLLYYDKIDLFKPAGTKDNGYRYYTLEQIDSFIAIQSLRAVQFPIKDLKEYFESPSQDTLQELAIGQVKKVEREIKKLQDIQFFLSRVIDITNEIETAKKGTLLLTELPAESVIYSSTKDIDWNNSMEELSEITSTFMKEMGVKGIAANGSVINKNDFLNRDFHQSACLFCRLEGPKAVSKPAGTYAIVYYQGNPENIASAYTYLLHELEAQNLILDGDVFEEYLLHSLATKKEEEYITKISVKVKKAII